MAGNTGTKVIRSGRVLNVIKEVEQRLQNHIKLADMEEAKGNTENVVYWESKAEEDRHIIGLLKGALPWL